MLRRLSPFVIALAWLILASVAQATEVKAITTPAGITAWTIEEHSVPIVSARIVFKRSGSAYDPAGKEGLSNLVTTLLNEGAGDLDAKAFQQAIEEKAIRLGIYSDEDFIIITLETLSEHAREAFRLLGLALTAPRFNEDAIERMRAATLSQLRQLESSPGYLAARAFRVAAFGNHPYARPTRGTEAGVQAITHDDLMAFAKAHFAKDALVISVVGDIDAKTLPSLLDTTFANLPAAATTKEIADISLPATGTRTAIERALPQSVVAFGVNGVKRKDPDYFPAYVMNYILGGDNLTSRLSEELRGKSGLAYYANSSLDTNTHSEMLSGSFATRADKAADATSQMIEIFSALGKNGATEEDVTLAKHYLMGSFPLQLDSNSALASYLIAMQVYDLGKDYLEKRNDYIRAVTLADVNRVAARLLDPSRLVIATVGPAPAPTTQEKNE